MHHLENHEIHNQISFTKKVSTEKRILFCYHIYSKNISVEDLRNWLIGLAGTAEMVPGVQSNIMQRSLLPDKLIVEYKL